MTGTRPSEQARPIFINDLLVADEMIETSANGGGQVLFLDQTSLTIAPNSSIVLDQYVYDPDAGSGAIGITVARGALRMIGGRITKTNAATIKTPSATIGIRGGMGNVSVNGEETLYMHVAGISSTIDTDSGSLTITKEGGFARIIPGAPPEFLGIATADLISQIFSSAATGSGDGGSASAGGAASSSGGSVGVSDSDGIITDNPVSTTGEQQAGAFGDLPVELTVSVDQELSDSNFMETVLDDIPLDTDAVGFVGDIDLTVVIDNGGARKHVRISVDAAEDSRHNTRPIFPSSR